MTIEEMAQQLSAAQAEATSAKTEAAAAKQKAEAQETTINNLDASIKAQQAVIDELKKMKAEQPKSYEKMIRETLEGQKGAIEKFMTESKNGGSQKLNVELKLATGDITLPTVGASARSLDIDPTVHAVPVLSNAFLLAFGVTGSNAAALNWIEATDNKVVGYVAELANNTNNTTTTFTEKNRKFAKLATYVEVSSEMQDWFEVLVDYVKNRVDALIDADLDQKVYSGVGNDTNKQNEIYGIKQDATAFAKLASYDNATIGDVLIDAIAQVKKGGYAANVAVLSYEALAALRGVKDANGRYLYNELTGMFGQLTIFPSDKIGAKEILVADNRCVDIKKGKVLEMEITRNAVNDSWRVDFRRRAQVKIAAPEKKGIILVADYDTAITAITA